MQEKPNITAKEASAILDKQTRDAKFTDGPYQYRLFAQFAEMSSYIGIIITLANTPETISGDLIVHVFNRVKSFLKDFNQDDVSQLHILITKIWVDDFGHSENMMSLITDPKTNSLQFKLGQKADVISQGTKAYDLRAFITTRDKKIKKLSKTIAKFNEVAGVLPMEVTNMFKYGGLAYDDEFIFNCKARSSFEASHNKNNQIEPTLTVLVDIRIDNDSPFFLGLKEHYSVDSVKNMITSPEFKDTYVKAINKYITYFFAYHTNTFVNFLVYQYPYYTPFSSKINMQTPT